MTYVDRCPFCSIGEESKRGVVWLGDDAGTSNYVCGLGEGCSVPGLYGELVELKKTVGEL